ncbi:MAG: hypothetical protein ACPGXL_02850 [Chitinophagales bacterium]
MKQVNAKLDEIHQKMEAILADHKRVKTDYLELVEERNILTNKLKQQEAYIAHLEEQYQLLKVSKAVSLSSITNKETLRVAVDQLIGEIDKCIGILNR